MNRKRGNICKYICSLLILGICLLLLPVFGSEQSLVQAATSEDSANSEKVALDVVLDWYPNAIHTFLYEAIGKGYFEEENLEVHLITPAQSVDAVNFVASGRAQIGLTYPVDIIESWSRGMPVVSIGAISQKALDCMCSLSSNEEVTADLVSLRGKVVGYAGTQVSKAVVDTVTAGAGLSEADYTLLNVGFDLVTSLITGNADLVVGTFINDEIVTMQNMGYEVHVYSEQDYGVPELYGLVMAVNKDDYLARTDIYEAFLRACKKGFEDMKADEDAALELIMTRMNNADNPLDETQQRESYEILLPRMETPDAPFLSMSESVWQEIISWMLETEQLHADIAAGDVMVVR